MNKNVLVSIIGLHNTDNKDNDSEIETKSQGIYGNINGSEVVVYEEKDDDNNVYRTTLRFRAGYLEVNRAGAAGSKMVFVLGDKTSTEYNTPYGALSLEFNTKSLDIVRDENSIEIKTEYSMSICGEHHADCVIRINIENE